MEEVNLAGGKCGIQELTSRTVISFRKSCFCVKKVDKQCNCQKKEKESHIEVLFSVSTCNRVSFHVD